MKELRCIPDSHGQWTAHPLIPVTQNRFSIWGRAGGHVLPKPPLPYTTACY